MATKGIWIPIEVLHDKSLTMQEKLIMLEINQLQELDTKSCYASNSHFAKMLNVSEKSVSNTISSLVKKERLDVKLSNRNHKRLLSIKDGHLSIKDGHLSINCGESKENKTINKTINIVETDKSVSKAPSFSIEDMELALLMFNNILAMNDGFKKPNLEKWAKEFRLMREIDNRTHGGIKLFIEHLYTGSEKVWEFWRGNILSPKSMRKNFDMVVTQYKIRLDK